jgi:hypothetical protein
LLIVVGLAISAPPSCVCSPDDHFGVLLHPLFPHAHGTSHVAGWWGIDETTGDALVTGTSMSQAPAISASASTDVTHDSIAGLLLPLSLAAMLLGLSSRRALFEPRPEQRALAPPIPPPRVILLVA